MSCRLHNCNCCTAHGNRIVPLSKLCGKKCLGTDTLHLQELLVHANPSHDAPRSKRCADVIVRGGLEVFKLSTQRQHSVGPEWFPFGIIALTVDRGISKRERFALILLPI